MISWRKRILAICIAACSATPLLAADGITVVAHPPTDGTHAQYVGNKTPLEPSPLLKLSIGSIEPKGWLRKQLELEASGMGGQLEQISPFLKFEGNGWMEASGKNGWEELPYWIRGYGDLGYVLKDPKIIAEAKKWIDGIISTQQPDGWFGPTGLKTALKGKPDMWPHMPVLNAMQTYYEYSGDTRVIPFMTSYFKWQNTLPATYFSKDWQDTRFGDNIESIYWLYNHTGESWLLELPPKMHANSAKWSKGVANWHNVNFSQGFREPAEYWMQAKDESLLAATDRNYQTAMSMYGQFPGGGFAADENARVGFHDPRQGFETCGIVELMRSFEMLSRISGDPTWLDRCEYIAFNSLPASMTPDEKALHYLTPANVVQLDHHNKSPGIQNGGTMISYSPKEVYRCCQHNHVMGWPLYAEHLWMATSDGGLCASIYNASEVSAKVSDGSTVKIAEESDYPFSDTVTFKMTTEKATRFPLYLRIPGWCSNASIKVNGTDAAAEAKPLQFVAIDRNWANGDTVTLTMPMKLGVRRWAQNGNSASVDYGPLSFSLKIGENYVKYGGTEDWPEQDVFATSPWNYGLVLDEADPTKSFEIVRKSGPVADQPFTAETAPIELKAKGKRIAEWTVDKNSLLRTLQQSPAKTYQPEEAITLIPMGAARLRISAFPVIGSGDDAHQWVDPKANATGPTAAATPTASYCNNSDSLAAINSGEMPQTSSDESVKRMTFWDHKGTAEWVQYDFKSSADVSSVAVYWFDDTGHGQCRVPQSWRLMYRDGQDWKPVEGASDFGTRTDTYNKVTFNKIKTDALRIELQLQPDVSAGVLQWQVMP